MRFADGGAYLIGSSLGALALGNDWNWLAGFGVSFAFMGAYLALVRPVVLRRVMKHRGANDARPFRDRRDGPFQAMRGWDTD